MNIDEYTTLRLLLEELEEKIISRLRKYMHNEHIFKINFLKLTDKYVHITINDNFNYKLPLEYIFCDDGVFELVLRELNDTSLKKAEEFKKDKKEIIMLNQKDIETTLNNLDTLKSLVETRYFKLLKVNNNFVMDYSEFWFIDSLSGEKLIIRYIEFDYDYYNIKNKYIPLDILTCSDEEFQQKINDIIGERNKQAIEKKERADRIKYNNELISYHKSKKKFEPSYTKEQLEYCNRLHRYYELTQDNSIFQNEDYAVFLKSLNDKFVLDLDKIYYLKNEDYTLIYEGIHKDQRIEIHLPITSMLKVGIN